MAPRIPESNWPDCENIQPSTTAPAFKNAWTKQKFKAICGVKFALLYSNPNVNPYAHLWQPIPTSNVKVALSVCWLPSAKHSIKAWILKASCVSKTDEDPELK